MVILDPNLVKSRVTKQMKSQQKEMSKVKGGEQRGLLLEWFHSTAGLTTKKFYLLFAINIVLEPSEVTPDGVLLLSSSGRKQFLW